MRCNAVKKFDWLFSDDDFQVRRGDRVAQLILERISMADIIEVDELPDTERGMAGFGSTGVSTVVASAVAMDVEITKKPRLDNGNKYD